MRKIFFTLSLILAALLAFAQQPAAPDFKVERDTAGGFLLVQGGQRTPFDTTTLQNNLQQKRDEQLALETEIQLLERLVMLRRQVIVAKQEQTTLLDIIDKARKAPAILPNTDKKAKGKP